VKLVFFPVASLVWLMATPQAKIIPMELWGKWVVTRVVPTTTIACWGDSEARALLATEMEYSRDLFRWKDVITRYPTALTEVVTAERFHDDNSGRGANSSQVTFRQLGLDAKEATQISIDHPPANITGGTVEIPGDHVLLKDKKYLITGLAAPEMGPF